jgi:hypothetical protein
MYCTTSVDGGGTDEDGRALSSSNRSCCPGETADALRRRSVQFAMDGEAAFASPTFRVSGSPSDWRLGVSGEDSSPAVILALKVRSPCMPCVRNALREGAFILAGRATRSFLRFFRSAVLVGGGEEDGEMRSEHASTASAATISAMRARAAEAAGLSFGGGVVGPRLRSSGEARDGESSISMADEAIPTAEAGSEADSEAKEKKVISIETNQQRGGRQGSWRE